MYDMQYFCDLCDFKCHQIHFLTAHKRAVHNLEEEITSGIPKKRPRIEIKTSSESETIGQDSYCPESGKTTTIKTETVEILEQNEPFADVPSIPSQQKPKFSLKGLLNKSNLKIVSSIKVFNCSICKQEGPGFEINAAKLLFF